MAPRASDGGARDAVPSFPSLPWFNKSRTQLIPIAGSARGARIMRKSNIGGSGRSKTSEALPQTDKRAL